MNAYTMNHLSTEQINAVNERERNARHHQEHVNEFWFFLSFVLAFGLAVLLIIFGG